MKKLNFKNKIMIGVSLISLSNVLKHLSIENLSNLNDFLQGFSVGLGMLLLIIGLLERRKLNVK